MKSLTAALLLLAGTAVPVSSQDRGVELGLGLSSLGVRVTAGETIFDFNLGGGSVRAGLFVSDQLAIEPSIGASVTAADDANLIQIGLGVGLPYYFRSTAGHSGLYIRPSAGVGIVSADASGFGESASQVNAGLGLGGKFPLADRIALRLEGNFSYGFESDVFDDVVALGSFVGLSFFTR